MGMCGPVPSSRIASLWRSLSLGSAYSEAAIGKLCS